MRHRAGYPLEGKPVLISHNLIKYLRWIRPSIREEMSLHYRVAVMPPPLNSMELNIRRLPTDCRPHGYGKDDPMYGRLRLDPKVPSG